MLSSLCSSRVCSYLHLPVLKVFQQHVCIFLSSVCHKSVYNRMCPHRVSVVFTPSCEPSTFQQGQYLPVSLLCSNGFDNFLYPHYVLFSKLPVSSLYSDSVHTISCPGSILTLFTSSCDLTVLYVHIFLCPHCTLCSHLPVFPLCSVFTVMYSLCSDGVHISIFHLSSLCVNSVETSTCVLIAL